MSIAIALTALSADVGNARDKIAEMGGTVTPNGGTSQLAADIATIPQGGGEALINGRKFECGTFTFPSTITSSYTIQHTLGKEPSAVFLWVVDPDYSVRGQVGKFRADHTTDFNSAAVIAGNGGIAVSTGASGHRFKTVWDSTTITFNCDSTYPLLPNMEYQWIAIA